jgi:tape measure domain-containing protein
MTDPKIRYDIEANATGKAEVDALGKAMRGLDDALPDSIRQRADALGKELQQLGAAKQAVEEFQRLGAAAQTANRDLSQTQSRFDDLRRTIEASGTATVAQSGQLQKLADALQSAKTRAEGAQAALGQAREKLEQLGQSGTTLAKTGDALKSIDQQAVRAAADVRTLTAEVERTRASAAAVEQLEGAFKTLGIRGVQSVEAEVQKLRNAVARIRLADPFGPDVQRATLAAEQRITALRAGLSQVPGAASAAGAGLATVAADSDRAGNALQSAARSALGVATALVGINSAADVAKGIVETGAAFEGLRVRLEQLLGSTDKAEAAFGMIKELARSTPFEVRDLTEAFAKLTSFGLKPTQEQMQTLADSAAVAGGGSEKLTGITLALGQAWAKGKLQGEEILQLVERGIPVWDLLAKATGKSVTELQELSSAGALGRDVIQKLFAAMGEANAGASVRLMDTFNGAISNTKDALAEFYDLIARSGALEYLTQQLQNALAEFDRLKDSGELEMTAKRISDSLIGIAEGAKTGFEALSKLAQIAPALGAVWVAGKVLDYATALRAAGAAALTATGLMVGATGAAATLGTTATTASVGVGLLSRALGLLGSLGLGAIILGVTELAGKFFKAKADAEALDKAVAEMLKGKPDAGAAKQVRDVASELEDFRKKAANLKNDIAALSGEGLAAFADQWRAGMRAIKGDTQAVQDGLVELGRRAAQALGGSVVTAADQVSDAFKGAQANLAVLVDTLPNLAKAGVDTGETVRKALSGLISKAQTEKDFDVLRDVLEDLGKRGVIGPRLLEQALQDVRKASDALKTSQGDLKKSTEDLNKAMDDRVKVLRAEQGLVVSGLQLEIAQSRLRQQEAARLGQQAVVDRERLKQMELEQRIRQVQNGQTMQEIRIGFENLDRIEKEARARGTFTRELEESLRVQRLALRAAVLDAEAKSLQTAAQDKQIERIKVGTETLGGATGATNDNTHATRTNTSATADSTKAAEQNADARSKQADGLKTVETMYGRVLNAQYALDRQQGNATPLGAGPGNITGRSNPISGVDGVRSAGGAENRLAANGGTDFSVLNQLLPERTAAGQLKIPAGYEFDVRKWEQAGRPVLSPGADYSAYLKPTAETAAQYRDFVSAPGVLARQAEDQARMDAFFSWQNQNPLTRGPAPGRAGSASAEAAFAPPDPQAASLQTLLSRIEANLASNAAARPAQSITLNVTASGDPDQVAQAVLRALEQAQRAGG